MSGSHYQRAVILVDRRRHKDAAEELGRHISQHPNDPWAYSLLAVCHSALKKDDEALAASKYAIGLDPDESWFHYILADLYYKQNLLFDSRNALAEAIRLAPSVARYWGLKANIESALSDWDTALQAAETGLEHDAGSIHCQNMRALALAKLGKKDESRATFGKSLSSDPENSLTFAYQGWTHVHNGEAEEAINAFTEALRLQPDLDWARLGMMNALRERHPIFATARKLSRPLPLALVTLIFIGSLVTFLYTLQLQKAIPWLWPIAAAPAACSSVLLLLAWLPVESVDDTLLRWMMQFDPRGKFLLTEEERKRANVSAIAVAVGLPIGIVLAMLRAHHASPPTSHMVARAHERSQVLPPVLAGFCIGLALFYAFAIVSKKKREEKRQLLTQAIIFETIAIVLTAIYAIIVYGPAELAKPVSFCFIAICVALAFGNAPQKLATRVRAQAFKVALKIWPYES